MHMPMSGLTVAPALPATAFTNVKMPQGIAVESRAVREEDKVRLGFHELLPTDDFVRPKSSLVRWMEINDRHSFGPKSCLESHGPNFQLQAADPDVVWAEHVSVSDRILFSFRARLVSGVGRIFARPFLAVACYASCVMGRATINRGLGKFSLRAVFKYWATYSFSFFVKISFHVLVLSFWKLVICSS
jgi:hypothetical protein